jgi:hypothetical protein
MFPPAIVLQLVPKKTKTFWLLQKNHLFNLAMYNMGLPYVTNYSNIIGTHTASHQYKYGA